jgi:hypothetical protein
MATAPKTKDVTAYGLHGMNNLTQPPAPLVDREGRITPHFIVNADPTDSGVVKKATGYGPPLSIPGLYSISGEELGLSVLLGAANGILYRIDPASGLKTALASVGPKSPLTYAEVNNKIYCSSAYWNGVYNLLTGEMEPWGLALPGVAPDVSLIPGDLPPGRYGLCYTRVTPDGLSMSGNGLIRHIEFQDQAQGIQLNNLEADFVPWMTQVNGGPLFLAEINAQGQITRQVPDFNPLTSLNIVPPPPFAHFAFAHGRFWGVVGRNLHYSEPSEIGDLGWFSRKTKTFLEDLVMVAPFTNGIYVSSLTSTWVLRETAPEKMKIERVGNGAIPGSLTMAKIQASMSGGAVPTREFADMSMMPTPVWRGPTSVVLGTHSGHLIFMTERGLKLSTRQYGAGLFRMQDGIPQIIMTAWGVAQNLDCEAQAIFQNGKLFEP